MTQINDPEVLAKAAPGETAWEGFGVGQVMYQRACDAPGCDRGLIYSPARYCGRCAGSGYLTRVEVTP